MLTKSLLSNFLICRKYMEIEIKRTLISDFIFCDYEKSSNLVKNFCEGFGENELIGDLGITKR